MTEQFRAPNPIVMAELQRLFASVGESNPYGPPLTFDDVLVIIEMQFGTAAARRCSFCVTYH
jgi:hypothetical protein